MHQQGVRAECFDGAELLRQRIDQRRDAVGCDDRVRVPVERDDQREAVVLAGVGDGLPDDLLVAEMHAVKHADGETDFAAAVVQFFGGVNDVHGRL